MKLLNIKDVGDHTFISTFNQYPIIVDLGAGKGDFTNEILKMYHDARLILVEAEPSLYRHLVNSFRNKKNT